MFRNSGQNNPDNGRGQSVFGNLVLGEILGCPATFILLNGQGFSYYLILPIKFSYLSYLHINTLIICN